MIACGLLLLAYSVYASIDGSGVPKTSMLANAMNNNILCTDLITLFIIYSIIMLVFVLTANYACLTMYV